MDATSDKEAALIASGTLYTNVRNVRDEQFASHEFFDPRDLVQVKYEMLRRVLVEGVSVTEAAAAFGFSRPPFYRAQQALEQGGLAALIPQPTGPKTAHKLTDEVLDYVEQLRNFDAELRAAQWSEKVLRKFGITVHPRSIQRAMERRRKKAR